jgi:hypothetical protein
MFLARAAALRSLDLSRQVGAAIFSSNAEILALGSNEVPKAGGGTYWTDDNFDDRDYVRKVDSNFVRKREILLEILNIIDPNADIEKLSKDIHHRRPRGRPAAIYLRAKAQHSNSTWAPRANPLAPSAERAGKCSGLK